MKPQQVMLPTHQWNKIEPLIKILGEGEFVSEEEHKEDYIFLCDIGIFKPNPAVFQLHDFKNDIDWFNLGKPNYIPEYLLTDSGNVFFEEVFIRHNTIEKEKILQKLLLDFSPTQAIQQYLWGVKNIGIDQVLTVLKKTNFWVFKEKKLLTHFLELLNLAKIIKYDRKNKKIVILVSPDKVSIPQNVYIDPTKPYGNIYWIKKLLSECEGYIYWVDKNFTNEAFDWLYTIADGNKIKEIRILSLDMGDQNLSKNAKKNYKRFREELLNRKITVVWKTIESTKIKDTHDRWIIGDNKFVRNVPDVNTISSGKRSEMTKSDNHKEILAAFLGYWALGVDVKI